MLVRTDTLARLRTALRRSRVVALLGPRQCGKTTLARQIVRPGSSNYFDLEDPIDLARLDQPAVALGPLRGTVVIDEVHRRPDLFPLLRVLADRSRTPARFLVLGSASPAILGQGAESLAGRIETIAIAGFSAPEAASATAQRAPAQPAARSPAWLDRLWLRGGFPRSYLARSEADSVAWRGDFVRTYLERDVPQFGVTIAASTLMRFWTMLAHWQGQLWNASEFARSLGASEKTARNYLDLLTDLLLVRQLQPWHENLAKRQVKSPKVYMRDTGLLHALLGVRSHRDLLGHPRLGASWEGWVIEQIIDVLHPDSAYFWATHQGAELDLMLTIDGRRVGVEVKRADAPTMTPSMRIAMADLSLERLVVVYPGDRRYAIADRIEAVPAAVLGDARALRGILTDRGS